MLLNNILTISIEFYFMRYKIYYEQSPDITAYMRQWNASANGFSYIQRKAIIWTNDVLSIGTLGKNLIEI